MTRPTRLGRVPLLSGPLGSTPVVEPDPSPDDPTDYASQAEAAAVQVGIDVGGVALVQSKTGHAADITSSITVVFDNPPQVGNTLIAVLINRNVPNQPTTPTGWTKHPAATTSQNGDGGRLTFFYKVAGPSESSTVSIGCVSSKDLYIAEWSGLGSALADNDVGWSSNSQQSAATSMATDPMTPLSGSGVIFAGWVQAARNPVLTIDAAYTDVFNVDVDPSGPAGVFGYKIIDPFSGTYTATSTSNQSDTWGSVLIGFAAASDETVWYPGPAANDGDDTSSAFSDAGGACLRVALEVARLIYRIELDVGQETSGATEYELFGSDDAAFTSPVLLGTLTFTATGSFTLDSTSMSWVPTTTYQYYQLDHISGGGDEREFYEIRLFSAAEFGTGVTEHGLLTGRDDPDQHPADAISLGDTAGWFAATEVESGLAELAAKAIGYQAHGNTGTTETFDAAYGWHSATLNANCTFTLTAAPTGTVSSLFIELAQDGTGGRIITLPASVVNKADLEADQDTTLSTTSFLVLLSRDGGTTWYGGWWGQSGGSDLTVEDEGTPLATFATTLDFVGDGVTASGTGAEKTITISGAPTGAAGGDLSGTYPNPSVVDDSHSHTSTTAPGSGGHVHVAEEIHLSDGSTTTYTLDAYYEPGSIQAWNRTTIARLTVTEVLPDQVTVSAAGSSGDQIVFDYAATLV